MDLSKLGRIVDIPFYHNPNIIVTVVFGNFLPSNFPSLLHTNIILMKQKQISKMIMFTHCLGQSDVEGHVLFVYPWLLVTSELVIWDQ